MSQVCIGPCCQNQQGDQAVYAMNNPGSNHRSHMNFHNNFASHLQARLANWRPSVYNSAHQNYIPTYEALYQLSMAAQQQSWALPPNNNDEKYQTTSQQSFVGAPQEHTFFDDEVNYRAEQSILFNPFKLVQRAAPRAVDTLTKALDPTDTRASDGVSFSSTGKCDAGPAVPHIQTNVDPNQFQPVRKEDWSRASIAGFGTTDDEDDALSPASTDATSHGPYTPTGFEGEAGFPEDAMCRFSQELSGSFDSTGSNMFKPNFEFSSRDVSSARQLTVAPPPTGIQHVNHVNSGFRGVPYQSNNAYGYTGSSDATAVTTAITTVDNSNLNLMRQASFRDADGFPANPLFALPTREHRVSSSSTHTTGSSSSEPQSDGELAKEAANRRRRDKFLLDQREKGMTYKEIKRRGKFSEAESTLRGRVRQLTKDKSERVRRPIWTDKDVRLLRTSVAYHRKLREEGAYIRHRDGKLPWKQISERMRDEGASYMFAPATCAKKYEDIGGR